ncbi:MAG: acylphosphatase [Thiobacillus sp.]
MLTLHLVIHGRVQGVWFRESMLQKANALGVHGWVRNRADRTVEAVVQGSDKAVAAMLDWARVGPQLASVTHLETTSATGEYSGFEKRDTTA